MIDVFKNDLKVFQRDFLHLDHLHHGKGIGLFFKEIRKRVK